jgi:hypothetical protein
VVDAKGSSCNWSLGADLVSVHKKRLIMVNNIAVLITLNTSKDR